MVRNRRRNLRGGRRGGEVRPLFGVGFKRYSSSRPSASGARGAHVIALATEGNEQMARQADAVLTLPAIDWMLQPMLAVIPLQVLAYEIARRRSLNVDQPRNLAKTVTVE